MQILTIGLLASLPALMYMQFDREKLSTLVDRWLHNIFRLDATLLTLADVDAKYGRRVEEFYNASLDPNRPHLDNRRRSRSPIVFATTLIAIGWILVLLNPGVSIPTEDFAARAYVKQLFTPAQNAIAFAFLGAYLFALQAVLRSYVRGDLRPKTYNNVSARIISAVIIGWLLEVVFSADSAPIYALAFFAGVVPETVLRRVWDLLWQGADKRPAGLRSNKSDHAQQDGTPEPYPLEERSPLSELDGIDIYDRTRLGEEGITSVQALVRHDFFDLTLSTRIPMARLIDWVDQSLLYQHVARSDRLHLRNIYGIRTATELLYAASELRSATPSAEHPSLLPKDQRSVRLKVICLSLEDDEWLPYVRTWRRSKQQKRPRTLHFGAAPTGLPPTSVEDVDAVRRSNGDTTRIAESHAG